MESCASAEPISSGLLSVLYTNTLLPIAMCDMLERGSVVMMQTPAVSQTLNR